MNTTIRTIGAAVQAVKASIEQLVQAPQGSQVAELRGIAFQVLARVPTGAEARGLAADIALDLHFMLDAAARRPGHAIVTLLKASCIVEGAAIAAA